MVDFVFNLGSKRWLMVCTWDQKFSFVEHRQLFLTAEPLDDARHLQIYIFHITWCFKEDFRKTPFLQIFLKNISPYLGAPV